MRKLSILLTSLSLFLSGPSFSFFCPTNFNQIEAGYTTEQVSALCGAPDTTETSELQPFSPQEWVYYIPQTVATNSLQQAQGTLRVSFSFDKNKKAINVSVNGIGVGSTTICGANLQLDDTPDAVKAACGNPAFINKAEQTNVDKKDESTKVITFIYNNPPTKLTFENGKLVKQE